MIVDHGIPGKPQRRRKRLGASFAIVFLFALPLLLAALFSAISASFLAQAKASLQTAADSAALAAAEALVDDAWLTGDPARQMAVITAARDAASTYAAANRVVARPVTLEMPATWAANSADGDVVFAFLDQPRSPNQADRILAVRDLDALYDNVPFLPLVNTVRVNARRLKARGTEVPLLGGFFTGAAAADVATRATATLDRDVVGFEPKGTQPVPLAPIALLSADPTTSANSWQGQLQQGNDNWILDSASGLCAAGSDELPEVTVQITADESAASALLLLLGVDDLLGASEQESFERQVVFGLAQNDLQAMGGTFALAPSNNRLVLGATRGDAGFYGELAARLNEIRGQKRAWPLYEVFDPSNGQGVVAGFVAARVIQASANSGGVTLVLQPCMLVTRTALTDAARRGVGGVNITNPYICKVRLVE